MKKILALGLCICMTAAVSACGSGQGQTAAGTVPAQAAVEKTAEGSGGETGTSDGNTEGAGAAGETGAGDSRSAEMDAPVQTEPLLVYLNDFDGVIEMCIRDRAKEDVFFSPGVVPALAFLLQALTSEGDGIIIQRPVYYPFTNKINGNNRKIFNSSLIYENGDYRMDYEDLEKKFADEAVKGMILCSPHNPVGRVWTCLLYTSL